MKLADAEVSAKGKEKQQSTLQPATGREKDSSSLMNAPARSPEEVYHAKLSQLRDVVWRVAQPQPKPSAKHLLLTVDAFGAPAQASEDPEYHFVGANARCIFTSNKFALPDPEAQEDPQHIILYGVDEWDGE